MSNYNLMKIVAAGKAAYFAGIPRNANPHKSGMERVAWFEGWDQGQIIEALESTIK